MWGKITRMHYWQACKLVWPLGKSILKYLKKSKTEVPYDLATSLLNMLLKDCKLAYNRDNCTALVIIEKL